MDTQEPKAPEERDSRFLWKIMDWLVVKHDLRPAGQLAVFFHAYNWLGGRWGCGSDSAERRNREYFLRLNPQCSEIMADAIVAGSFKPDRFIHPFEFYITTSGQCDWLVLPEFLATVDELAQNHDQYERDSDGIEFLAFIYMFFLAIHPFLDGNGHVARNLLDYYSRWMHLAIKDVWNHPDSEYLQTAVSDRPSVQMPRKFSHECRHKQAFRTFFEKDIGLKPHFIEDIDSASVISKLIVERKDDLLVLSRYLIQTAQMVRTTKSVKNIAGVSEMTALILSLQAETK